MLECKLVEQLVEQPQLVEQHVEHLQLLEQQQSSTGGIDIGDNGLSSPQRRGVEVDSFIEDYNPKQRLE
jgi:hypothetical protein